MSDIVLGKLVEGEVERDAIHVAVIPMIASEKLKPAQRVGVVSNGVAGPSANIVGIVDPYLTKPVPAGAKFFLCLLPNIVTGMKHHWIHPAFEPDKDSSEQWLRSYAENHNHYDSPEEAFQRLLHGLRSRDLYFHGSDLHGLWELDDADDLRHHAEIYLGIRIDWDDYSFSCSC